jgi:AcrR family transcriptional regulator
MQLTAPPRPDDAPAAPDRSAEILMRLRPVFAEKGFDGASMQDMARAAGMSVGNFYRYFPSKSAIVEAMVTVDLREIEGIFAAIGTSADRMATLRATLRQRICDPACAEDGRLWAEVTALSLRKPEIGAAAARMEEAVSALLTDVFACATGRPAAEARGRYAAQARLVILLIKGTAMRVPCAGGDGDLAALVVRTIDRILDDISADAVKE